MKITNIFSKRRLTTKERLQFFISRKVEFIAIKYFPNSILGKTLNQQLFSKNHDFTSIELSLNSIVICEYVKKEDAAKLKKGIIDLFKAYKHPGLMLNLSLNDFDSWVDNVTGKHDLYKWTNLGRIKFRDSQLIKDYVSYIEISAVEFSSSLIAVIIYVKPSTSFVNYLNSVLLKNINSPKILSWPNFKLLIKEGFWPGKFIATETTKNIMIEDMIAELKYQCLKKVSEYLPFFFCELNILSPSINCFTTNIDHYDNSLTARHLWRALNILNFKGDMSSDGQYSMFLSSPLEGYALNNYTMIFKNTILDKVAAETYGSYENYLHILTKDLIPNVFFVPVLNTFLQFYENNFFKLKRKIFKYLGSNKNNIHTLLTYKNEHESLVGLFDRFKAQASDPIIHQIIKENTYYLSILPFRKATMLESLVSTIETRFNRLNQEAEEMRSFLEHRISISQTRNMLRYNISMTCISTLNLLLGVVAAVLIITSTLLTLYVVNQITLPELINIINEIFK